MGRVFDPRAWIALAAALLQSALGCDLAPGERKVEFSLCKANVASLNVLPPREGHPLGLAVQLTGSGTAEFAQVTESNQGETLEVSFADRIFLSRPIQGRIRSGLLINTGFASEAEAQGAAQELLAHLPDQPCGLRR